MNEESFHYSAVNDGTPLPLVSVVIRTGPFEPAVEASGLAM
jgi:hypothetical protein